MKTLLVASVLLLTVVAVTPSSSANALPAECQPSNMPVLPLWDMAMQALACENALYDSAETANCNVQRTVYDDIIGGPANQIKCIRLPEN